MKVIVLCSSDYSFLSSQTGEVIEGANLFYLSPVNSNKNVNGNEISKLSLSLEDYHEFGLKSMQFPAICSLDMIVGTTIKGRAFSKLASIEYLKSVDLLGLIK